MSNLSYQAQEILKKIQSRKITLEDGLKLLKQLRQETNIFYYTDIWEDVTEKSASRQTVSPILIFSQNESLSSQFRGKFDLSNIIWVRWGKRYQQSPDNGYIIEPESREDYTRLFRELRDNDILIDTIVYLSPAASEQNYLNALPSIHPLFYLTQELIKQRKKVWFLYLHSGHSLMDAAIGGFFRTVHLENPKFFFQISELENPLNPRKLLDELQSEEINAEIRYLNGQRQIKRFREIAPDAFGDSLIKENGVYLITGGTGGLGLILADHLVRKWKSRLILAGRSELTPEKESRLKSIEEHSSSKVIYIKTDISVRKQVENLVREAKSRFGRINGIIHAAGEIRDSFVQNKNKEDIEAVLAPKILGTVCLDEVTKDEHLDFFVLFSSLCSVIGNTGQSDYAYANSFMDHFAEFRETLRKNGKRSGKTLSFDWTLWKDGGMQISEETEQLLARTIGLIPLSTDKGLEAFEKGLAATVNRFIVVSGNEMKIRRLMDQKILASESVQSSPKPLRPVTADLFAEIQKKLSAVTSEILKIEESYIDPDEEISAYGFDSISLTQLITRVNDSYNLELMPAVFFEHTSLNSFARFLCEEYKEKLIPYCDKNSPPSASLPPPLFFKERGFGGEFDRNSDAAGQTYIEVPIKPRFSLPKNNVKDSANVSGDSVAIIGMSGVMPQSEDLETFWDHLENGDDLIIEIPEDRWDWKACYGDPVTSENKTNIKWGGFMKDIDKFDASFFNISPREADLMDPQQRIFLETVWKCIEDAGYKASQISGKKVGLFVGVSAHDYNDLMIMNNLPVEAHSSTGTANCILANRISYILNLHGPSEAIDTACSSSLIAIHRAVMSLKNGECETAIAGGVHVILTPKYHIAFSKAGMLSPEGRCKTFDSSADGYVRGEGAGAVWLKSLCTAAADGDHIYGVIKSTAVNHGGHVSSLTVPNPNAQAELLIQAYKNADIDPATVSYIETHGTGTKLGDPVEINGIKKAFKKLYEDRNKPYSGIKSCGLGTVKTNIGHLEASSGIAGVLKVLMAIKHKTLPPTVHLRNINPQIQLEETPFYIVQEKTPWKPLDHETGKPIPRIAGISSFGFGGANAHVVISEHLPVNKEQVSEEPSLTPDKLIVLSAKNKEQLRLYCKSIADFLNNRRTAANIPLYSINNIAYTLQTGREAMDERMAVVVSDVNELKEKLIQYCEGQNGIENLYTGNSSGKKAISQLLSEEESEDFINIILRKSKPGRLAQLWVSGVDIDWNVLYRDSRSFQRLSLPAYPFARVRHWIKSKSSIPLQADESFENFFFVPRWIRHPLNNVSENLAKKENQAILVVYPADMASIGKAMRQICPKDRVLEIRLGINDGQLSEDVWQADTTDPQSMDRCIRQINAVDRIYFFGGIQTGLEDIEDVSILSRFQDQSVIALFRLLKSLITHDVIQRCQQLSIITNDLYAVIPEDRIMPFSGSLSGLVHVIAKEYPNIAVSCTDIALKGNSEQDTLQLLRPAIVETGRRQYAEITAIRNGERYIRRIEPIQLPAVQNTVFKRNGVYIILGGAGGIGLELGKYLAETFQAKLAIVGRRQSLNPQQKQAVSAMEAAGGKVLYLRADASDKQQMQAVVENVRSTFGAINGAIHSAVALMDKAFYNMDEKTFREVLSPKVEGSFILYDVLKKEPLDFMLFFSSSQSFFCNAGQSNYAAACTFKDAFALWLAQRVTYPVRIVNWGFWGIGVVANDEYRKRMAAQGVKPIEPAQGIEAIRRIMAQDIPQIIPLKVEQKFWDQTLLREHQALPLQPSAPVRSKSVSVQAAHAAIVKAIRDTLADVLQLENQSIENSVSYDDMGLDSILAMEVVRKLNETFGILLKPMDLFNYPVIEDLANHIFNCQLSANSEQLSEEPADKLSLINDNNSVITDKPSVIIDNNSVITDKPSLITDIAIIGMSGKFPDAGNLDEFWKNLAAGRDSVREIPDDRWNAEEFYDPDPKAPNKSYSKWGAFLSDADEFDPLFFNISPKEAELTDPQQRLFLQGAWQSLEDAGYMSKELEKKKCGVFVGCTPGDYLAKLHEKNIEPDAYSWLGNSSSILAARISYILNLKGPSIAIDTACSSALVAVHLACESIRSGTCEMALAGGVLVMSTPSFHLFASKAGILSPDGKCRTFDQSANGIVPGECVGVLVLKPLQSALTAGDHIYAVIKGTSINQDGKTQGITAPSAPSQTSLLREVYDTYHINPETIGYVEAHGTGTKLGDPIEITGLTDAFRNYTQKKQYCAIGSVKTNIGHTLSAAGIAGLIKAVLCLNKRKLVPSIHFEKENEHIAFKDSPFYVNTVLKDWETEPGSKRRAVVSSFGFSGTNAHAVVEEAPETDRRHLEKPGWLMVLSARTFEQLRRQAELLIGHLEQEPLTDCGNMSYTLLLGRRHFEHRLACVICSQSELVLFLKDWLEKGDAKNSVRYVSPVPTQEKPSLKRYGNQCIRDCLVKNHPDEYLELLNTVADLYVQGYTLEFEKLFENDSYCKIPLPTYPFARERYSAVSALSSDSPLSSAQSFTGDEFFLSDHVVNGQRILPGVVYLEMARAAAARAAKIPENGIRLKDVVWASPLVAGDASVRAHVRLFPKENREIAFEIFTGSDDAGQMHCRGTASYAEDEGQRAEGRGQRAEDGKIMLSSVFNPLSSATQFSREQCYEAFRGMGIDYGPGLRGIENLYVESDRVLAKLVIPASVADTQNQFVLHPSLMDSAFQATAGFVMGSSPPRPFLPFALQELEILGKCFPAMWAMIRHTQTQYFEKIRKFDIDLCDENGNIQVRMKGLALAVHKGEQSAASTTRSSESAVMLSPVWKRVQAVKGQTLPFSDDQVVIVGGTESIRNAVRQFYPKAHVLEIPSEDTIESLSEKLKSYDSVNHILWITPYHLSRFPADDSIIEAQNTGVIPCFRMIKALLLQGWGDRNLGWTVITVQTQSVDANDPVSPAHASIHGLIGSMAKEYPNWKVRLIDLEADGNMPLAEIFDLPPDSQGDAWVYRKQHWYRQELVILRNLTPGQSLYKPKGTYVVIGGAGGIGEAWTKYMADRWQARIIWIGRRKKDKTIQSKLDSVAAAGQAPLYITADASSLKDMQRAYKEIKSRYWHIDGVVHSAIVLSDKTLANMEEKQFISALVPKIDASVRTAQIFQDEPLDFMLFFSAMQTFTKAPGQSNYAAGCNFTDAFAQRLFREMKRPVKVINWGYWGSVGVAASEFYRNRMAQAGIGSIEPPEAMDALEKLLASPISQMVFVKISNPSAIRRINFDESVENIRQETVVDDPLPENREQLSAVSSDKAEIRSLREKSIEWLKKLIGETLKIRTQQIKSSAPLEKYGIDSIMVIQLTDKLRKVFDNISSTLLFEYQTIDALTDYFVRTQRDALIQLLVNSGQLPVNDEQLSVNSEQLSVNSEQLSEEPADSPSLITDNNYSSINEIAVIGVSGRYPMANDLNEFWENLKNGRDCITEIPEDRWDWRKYYNSDKNKKGKIYAKWGGFIKDADKFDARFFNISPREAELTDPQERIFLETAWHTLEDAGYTRSGLWGTRTGVFVGVMYGEYQLLASEEDSLSVPSAFYASVANRVSWFFNFKGPSMAVDTMCSSSLTAIHLACESIRRRECETAIAGGVNLSLHPRKYFQLSQGKFASTDGRCRSFGQGGDGFVPGEGVGAVLLKPLNCAVRDNDRIYAVLKGSFINHGGKTNGYTVPNPNAQAELISDAVRRSGINPKTVSYIEAHGTGTGLGDPIEITALTKAFEEYTRERQYCAIGSVKSNIGHAESAAGIAGLTKVLLQMKHRKLVPSLHSQSLNPNIHFKDTPFYVQQELSDWNRLRITENGQKTAPRRAAVSSFGAGGANAHLIVEEYTGKTVPTPERGNSLPSASLPPPLFFKERGLGGEFGEFLIVLSARNENRLESYARNMTEFLSQNGHLLSLADIAYTLQIGREPMKERLALTVSDIDELKDKLICFVQGKKHNLYCGNIAMKDEDEKIGDEVVRDLIQNRELEKLAQFWVQGVDIDWNLLYPNDIPNRISLPLYPFARERYWIPNPLSDSSARSPQKSDEMKVMRDALSLKGQSFIIRLTGNEFFLNDHVIAGQKVLPGAVYVEMARSAGEIYGETNVRKLTHVVWTNPVIVSDHPREIHIGLYSETESRVGFEVWSSDENRQKQIHAQGKIVYEDQSDKYESEISEIDRIRERCPYKLTGAEVYSRFERNGLNYGTGFQVIKEVFYNDTESLSVIEKPNLSKDFLLKLHPSIIDGAFQTAGILFKETETIRLPFMLGEIEILNEMTGRCYAHAVLTEDAGSLSAKADIRIADETGNILIIINNFMVSGKRIDSEPLSVQTPHPLYFQTVWENSSPSASLSPPLFFKERGLGGEFGQLPETLLIFDNHPDLCNALNTLQRSYAHGNARVIQIKQGEQYRKHGDNIHEIRPAAPEDYTKLIHDILKQDMSVGIIHCWSSKGYELTDIDIQIDTGLYPVFYLIQALAKVNPKAKIRLQYVYTAAPDNPKPYDAAISGFLKSLGHENPYFFGKTVEIGEPLSEISEQLSEIIIREFSSDEAEIRYVDGQRFVRQFLPLSVISNQREHNAVLPSKNGVYLITGGLGGLGLIFAKYLAEEYQASLILTGRSEVTSEKEAELRKLRASGSQVLCIRNDISKPEHAEKLIRDIRAEFGKLNGIIHSAGIVRDAFAVNKIRSDMDAVLAPKVRGTVWLDNAAKDEKMDFFVLFSSIAGANGNPGQCDYAYGNSFLDNFAEFREHLRSQGKRSGKTLSINWPLWKHGGMRVSDQAEKTLFRISGMKPLQTETGIKAFITGLSLPHIRLLVAEGDPVKIRKSLSSERDSSKLKPVNSNQRSNDESKASHLRLTAVIRSHLTEIVSKILKIAEKDIDPNENISDYGFDSVTMTEVTNAVNEKYEAVIHGVGITPAVFLEFQTLASLADYLIQEYSEPMMRHYNAMLKNENSNPLSEIEEPLSEEPIDKPSPKTDSAYHSMDIAIIGIGGRYPSAKNPDEYWENLRTGKCCITDIPKDRWDWRKYYDPDPAKGKLYCRKGAFLEDTDKFDPLFFNISPTEAGMMDPEERIMLETVWNAAENAGYTRESLKNQKVGVFVGISSSTYSLLGEKESTKTAYFSVPNRISHFFDFTGPSMAVDTGCSSSLAAIHMACQSIKTGECDVAVAGGVNLCFHPSKYLILCQNRLVSSQETCKLFDKNADGFIPGEAAGAVLLKPLNRAAADGDYIYGVIRASGVSHKGKNAGYMVPSPLSLTALIKEVIQKSGFSPETIGYVELQASGSRMVNEVEWRSLNRAYQELSGNKPQRTNSGRQCALGAVKPNIGHAEAASGIAAVTKVLLQMKHGQFAPVLLAEEMSPEIQPKHSPFYFNESLTDWNQHPRRAGIMSFGAGGTQAYLIAEAYEQERLKNSENPHEELVVVSARSLEQVNQYLADLKDYLSEHPEQSLSDIAFTLQVGREAFNYRFAVIARTAQELFEALSRYLDKREMHQPFFTGNSRKSADFSEETLNSVYKNKDLKTAASLWVHGVPIDWTRLQQSEKRNRIPLPTYPFEKRRCWMYPSISEPLSSDSETKEVMEVKGIKDIIPATEQKIIELMCQLLETKPDDLYPEGLFSEFGINSLMGVKLLDMINRNMRLELKAEAIYNYPSIRALSKYITETYGLHSPLQPSGVVTQARSHIRRPSSSSGRDVAVIGISCRFPGADNIREFWENLCMGKDSVTEVPKDRWDSAIYYDPDPGKTGKTCCKWGGFINDADKFDHLYFNISRAEAEVTEPHQRLFLQECISALEDAGYPKSSLNTVNCGVYAGVVSAGYDGFWNDDALPDNSGHLMLGTSNSILSSRISYFLNLKGPAMTLDTACSSSLIAVSMACKSLADGETDMMLAGGITLFPGVKPFIVMSRAGMLSPTGKCRPFDNNADGIVPGEGSGVVVLKLLNRAIADGDHIYGVIKAYGMNQDGRTNGITAPSAQAQASLLLSIYEKFGINPETISYAEAHGTGTPLGDPIEIAALTESFRRYTDKTQFCPIGSVKSNIGHSTGAAGIAGLIKVLLGLKYGKIPPTLHFKEKNRHIEFEKTPVYVNTELIEWTRKNGCPRRGTVSSFGFSGTNCHMVVEECQRNAECRILNSECTDMNHERNAECRILNSECTDMNHERNAECRILNSECTDMNHERNAECRILNSECTDMNHERNAECRILNSECTDMNHERNAECRILNSECTDMNHERNAECRILNSECTDMNHERNAECRMQNSECTDTNHSAFSIHNSAFLFPLSAGDEERLKVYARTMVDFLDKNLPADNHLFLTDMAYTLQTGREPMQERLAVLVSDIGEFREKLTQYCRGESDMPNLYTGNVKKIKQIDLILSGNPGKQFMKAVIEDNDFRRIAMLWVSGVEIDWNLLYPKQRPNRMSLPTYPFAGNRYRLRAEGINKKQNIDPEIADNKLHQPSDKPKRIVLKPVEKDGIRNYESDKPKKIVLKNQNISEIPDSSSVKSDSPDFHPVSITLQKELAKIFAEVLYMEPGEEVDEDKNFVDMGMDSIVGVEWIRIINKRYGTSIGAARIYDYPTLREFAQFMEKELRLPAARPNPPSLQSDSALSLDELLKQVQQGKLNPEQADIRLSKYDFQDFNHEQNPLESET